MFFIEVAFLNLKDLLLKKKRAKEAQMARYYRLK